MTRKRVVAAAQGRRRGGRRGGLPHVTIVPARRPVPDRYAIHREPGTKKKCRTPLTAADCSVCY